MSEGDLKDMSELVDDLMPGISDSVDISQMLTEGMRIFAFPADVELLQADTPANMNIVILEWPANLSMEFMLTLNAQTLEQAFEDAQVLSIDHGTNASGLEQGSIAYVVNFPEVGSVFGNAAIYRVGDYMVTVTGGVSEEYRDRLAPVFEGVFDSVRLLEN